MWPTTDTSDSAAAEPVSLNVHVNIAPVVTASTRVQPYAAMKSTPDPVCGRPGRGDARIALLYFFWDNNPDPASGYFTVNGVVQAAHTTFAVERGATGGRPPSRPGSWPRRSVRERLGFQPLQRAAREHHINVPPNQAPTVTAADFSASKGQVFSASDLFTANDANGDPLLYFFYDKSADPASGHFTVNGVVQAAGTTFAVSAAQLATDHLHGRGQVSDDLFVNAWDGIAFSEPKEFHVNVDGQRADGHGAQQNGDERRGV